MLVRAALVAAAFVQPAAAQAPLGAQLDALLAASYSADEPGATLIVTRGGKPLYAGARGMADVAAKRPLTPDSVIRIGSITKQFTAAIVLQLVAEGRLSLDDRLSTFYPDYPGPGAAVTVRQLLNHTSGIQSYTGIPGWMTPANTARAFTTDALIAEFRDRPAVFPAGTKWEYNNSGYVLLGGIIEKVTGAPWYRAVETRIAKPLRLTTIRYGNPPATPAWATPYGALGLAQAVDMSVPGAAGALVGSVGDVARWAHALHHGKVVPPALYAQMIAPTRLADGTVAPYGFGLGNARLRGVEAITHSGGIFGASTDSLYLPSHDVFVAVFANTDEPRTSPGLVMRRAAALAIGKPYATLPVVPLDAQAIAPMLGVYAIAGGTEQRSLYIEKGKLFSRRGSAAPIEAFPAGGGRFSLGPNTLSWFRIVPQGGGYVMEMHQGGEDAAERATRTGPVPPAAAAVVLPRATMERYAGRYDLQLVTATVAIDGEWLTAQIPGQPPFPLAPSSPTQFTVVGVPAEVTLDGETMTIRQSGRVLTGRRMPG